MQEASHRASETEGTTRISVLPTKAGRAFETGERGGPTKEDSAVLQSFLLLFLRRRRSFRCFFYFSQRPFSPATAQKNSLWGLFSFRRPFPSLLSLRPPIPPLVFNCFLSGFLLSLCLPLELGVWKKREGGGAFKDAPPSSTKASLTQKETSSEEGRIPSVVSVASTREQ